MWITRALALSGIVASAIVAKEARFKPRPLLGVEVVSSVDGHSPITVQTDASQNASPQTPITSDTLVSHHGVWRLPQSESVASRPAVSETLLADARGFVPDPSLRWFSARPVRPARMIWMTVTAYSPHEESCGESADGLTATLHAVSTNAHRLVAADPQVLDYGTLLSVPGYAEIDTGTVREPAIVPVLDCGGKIRGYRLDVLFPTHDEALNWGVRTLPVTVWEYADGQPAQDPRKAR